MSEYACFDCGIPSIPELEATVMMVLMWSG